MGYEGKRVSALGDPALGGETLDERVEAFGRQIQRRADLLAWCPGAKRRSPVCRRERAFHSYRKRIERVAREERVGKAHRSSTRDQLACRGIAVRRIESAARRRLVERPRDVQCGEESRRGGGSAAPLEDGDGLAATTHPLA